jgi:hypothetical protein
MDGALATSRPLIAPPPQVYYGAFISADTSTIGLMRSLNKELDTLLTLENCDGYIFQASQHAYENAKLYIEMGATFVGPLFRRPEFVPDGEGGIDIEWANGGKKMTLSCRGNDTKRDYIYWEKDGQYEAKDFTPIRLVNKLLWLDDA